MSQYNQASHPPADSLIPLPPWKRAVIKVGSALVAPDGTGPSTKYALAIAAFIIESRSRGKEIILVSSGAVASGLALQPGLSRPLLSMQSKQALAAIGQSRLMQHWSRFFDFPCAQLLLTFDDIYHRKRFINAKNTLTELLRLQTLPIVNENDTVAIEELKVGDNDNLAAHVAVLADADLLILCSDIDALFTADPHRHPDAEPIHTVDRIDESIYALAGGSVNPTAVGGMHTKIEAAAKAVSRGIHTALINGTRHHNFELLLEGKLNGTLFMRQEHPLAAKKHWMVHALPRSGRLVIDDGAARALLQRGASLLPSGISAVEGRFMAGDAVDIADGDNRVLARGIVQYSAAELRRIRGHKSSEIEALLGYLLSDVAVHRDDLVLMESSKGAKPND